MRRYRGFNDRPFGLAGSCPARLPRTYSRVPHMSRSSASGCALSVSAGIARRHRRKVRQHRIPRFPGAWIRGRRPASLPALERESDRLAHAIVATLTGMALVKFDDDPEPPPISLTMLSQLVEHN